MIVSSRFSPTVAQMLASLGRLGAWEEYCAEKACKARKAIVKVIAFSSS